MDNAVTIVLPPDLTANEPFVLLVSRSGAMFGGGATSAFGVHHLSFKTDKDQRPYEVLGIDSKREVIVSFPWGVPYTLVARAQVEFMSPVEATKRQKEEEDAMSAVYESAAKKETESATPAAGYR